MAVGVGGEVIQLAEATFLVECEGCFIVVSVSGQRQSLNPFILEDSFQFIHQSLAGAGIFLMGTYMQNVDGTHTSSQSSCSISKNICHLIIL